MSPSSVEIQIQDPTQVGEARRKSAKLAEAAGLSEQAASNFAISVNELGTNILKHAESGSLILNIDDDGVEVVALDRGPGTSELARCLQDGFSTKGTAGNGLGAVMRLASVADFYSQPGLGFAAYARFDRSSEVSPAVQSHTSDVEVGGVCVPYAGEDQSGDSWKVVFDGPKVFLAVADGLGHGLLASEASQTAMQVFSEHPDLTPQQQIQSFHVSLRGTRGAAASVAQFDFESGVTSYCGVGNVTLTEIGEEKNQRMISYDGTLGLQVRRIQELAYNQDSAFYVMHSDGISSSWDLKKYPGIQRRHPTLIAGILFRDFRKKDDSTVVVLRRMKGNA